MLLYVPVREVFGLPSHWVLNVPSTVFLVLVVFVFFFIVIVWHELHFPIIAERMVSISVPSCHGLQQASISYQNPIEGLSRPISLSALQSERLLPVWFVQWVPVLSYRLLWHVPMSNLTLVNWNHCDQPSLLLSQEVMLWTHGLRDGYKIMLKKKKKEEKENKWKIERMNNEKTPRMDTQLLDKCDE